MNFEAKYGDDQYLNMNKTLFLVSKQLKLVWGMSIYLRTRRNGDKKQMGGAKSIIDASPKLIV